MIIVGLGWFWFHLNLWKIVIHFAIFANGFLLFHLQMQREILMHGKMIYIFRNRPCKGLTFVENFNHGHRTWSIMLRPEGGSMDALVRRLRVFPRRTRATPWDDGVRIGEPGLFDRGMERVDVSVTFTWDLPKAERISALWAERAPTTIGGPAVGTVGQEFTPGEFLRTGYTITSRGCPERCWFCGAWKRDGAKARELPIRDGWNVLDDNLLACNEAHIRAVFAMLARQTRRVEFTGGLHAARLKPWHVDLLCGLKPRPAIWLAYDEENDLDPLREACRMLLAAGWTAESHRLRAYVLCGYPGDTQTTAEIRLRTAVAAGCTPMAMVYRGDGGVEAYGWHDWARQWIRPACIHAANKVI